MPLLRYFSWVGGVLLGLMFALDVYLPKPAPRPSYDIDRTTIRVEARGPEYSIPYAPDESATLPVAEAKPASTAQAFAKYEPERKAKPRHKRPVDAAKREEDARFAEQGQQSGWSNNWSGNNWNNSGSWSSNNGRSNNTWANNGWSNNSSRSWR